MTSAPSVSIAPGSIIAGRYEILGSLGAGGMATVWKARDRELDVDVALKVLKASPSRDPVLAQRFRSEIRLAWRVRHRNVCGIHEYGKDGDLLFISMELVEGKDLRRLVAERGPLDWEQALDVAIQIAEGLEAIHQAGVIHRDLKPANITRDAHGLVRVMDFGIAKVWGEESGDGATRTGHVVGSPEYMSPEQVRGTSLDFRSDIYSLGLVLYEILTGLPPFRGAWLKRLEEGPDLEGPAAQRIPPAVLPILRRALACETGARYQTCSEILADLRAARAALASEPTDPLSSRTASKTSTGPTPASMPVQTFSREAQARILIPPLIRATRHADREVRLGAVEALGRLGGDGLVGEPVRGLAAEGLENVQRDEDERVRQAAVRALARVPRPAPPAPAPRPAPSPRPTPEPLDVSTPAPGPVPEPVSKPVPKPVPSPPIEDRSSAPAPVPVRRPSRSLMRVLILPAVVAGVLALVWIWMSRPGRAPAAVPSEPPLTVADSAPEATLPAPPPEVATPAPVTPSSTAPQVEAPPTTAAQIASRPAVPSSRGSGPAPRPGPSASPVRSSPVPTAVASAAPTTLPEPAPTAASEPPGPSPVAGPAVAPSADASPLVETPPTTVPPPTAPPVTEAPTVKPECLKCPVPEAAVVLADRLGLARVVRLRVHVSATGDVLRVDYLAGPLPIRDAITQAVRRWRFRPALRGSVPVASFWEFDVKL